MYYDDALVDEVAPADAALLEVLGVLLVVPQAAVVGDQKRSADTTGVAVEEDGVCCRRRGSS